MNLNVCAKRPATTIVKGELKQIEEVIKFNLWQTPTNVTYDIIAQEDILQAYIDWVKSISLDRQLPVYADDDILCELEPIRYETINDGVIHIDGLTDWIEYCNDEDYVIEWFYM